MSDAVAALDAGDYAAARRALERASAVRPGEAVVADGLRRVEEGDRAVALARHRDAAAALESKEDWWGALAEYEAALRLDPTVAFALDGRGRAARRARLADRLEFHARHEERLTTEAVAREAEGVLQEAREVDSPGPRLRLQVGALERALARSRVVVRVVLRSDGVTNVVVQRVGAIGAFEEKSLELRPGSYVVVGTRRGYRDVRRTLVVDPEAPPAPLLVRCEEAI
jgi:tetratricopeptide (TPR) repeat protein